MSLRARLALVLAGVMVGPLVAASVAVGVLVPRAQADAATTSLQRAVAGSSAYLAEQCLALGDTARVVALDLLNRVPTGKDVEGPAAQAAAAAAVERRADVSVAVLPPDGGRAPVAQAGRLAGTLDPAVLDGTAGASCTRRQALGSGPVLLAESVPVQENGGAVVARVVALQPLDGQALVDLTVRLGIETQLALVAVDAGRGAGRVVASTDPSADLAGLLAEVGGGARAGAAGEHRYAAVQAPPGLPWTVVAWTPLERTDLLRLLAVVVALAMALCVAALAILGGRLTRPLESLTATARRLGGGDLSARSGIRSQDEVGTLARAFDTMAGDLETTVGELRSNEAALSQTFARFGEALGRTHDLEGLLQTVVEAARAGASASVGSAMLGDARTLVDGLSSVADDAGPGADAVLEVLTGLSREAVDEGRLVMVAEALPAGPALAVPLHRGERVVGALAVARSRGEPLFEEQAVAAVRALATHAGTAVANVREHEETRRLSVTDPLTGAGNFRQLSTTLAREVERATRFNRPLSVLMLDLDFFKQVNDTLGHAFGDAVLREFARRLQDCLREVDTVARYGGEEFAVVLPETATDGAGAVAARIVQAVRDEPFTALGRSRAVTVSVGVASFPQHGRTSSDVMRAADAALYRAKEGGRDRWQVAEMLVLPQEAGAR